MKGKREGILFATAMWSTTPCDPASPTKEGVALRAWRKARGISLERAAYAATISVVTLCKLELGELDFKFPAQWDTLTARLRHQFERREVAA